MVYIVCADVCMHGRWASDLMSWIYEDILYGSLENIFKSIAVLECILAKYQNQYALHKVHPVSYTLIKHTRLVLFRIMNEYCVVLWSSLFARCVKILKSIRVLSGHHISFAFINMNLNFHSRLLSSWETKSWHDTFLIVLDHIWVGRYWKLNMYTLY